MCRAADPGAFVFAWETALRPATIERLKVEDYDRVRKRVTIRDSADKARFGRELPLTERAWNALEGVCPKSGPLFGRAKLRETLKAAAKAAGLPDAIAKRVTPYTLRHSRITHLASVTTDLRGVAYLAGHKDLTTTSHYVHGDVKAGERVPLAAATATAAIPPAGTAVSTSPTTTSTPAPEFGRPPPETASSHPRSHPHWPRKPKQFQRPRRLLSASGSCARKGVEVRVLSFAPQKTRNEPGVRQSGW